MLRTAKCTASADQMLRERWLRQENLRDTHVDACPF